MGVDEWLSLITFIDDDDFLMDDAQHNEYKGTSLHRSSCTCKKSILRGGLS